jgi:transposase-like protein
VQDLRIVLSLVPALLQRGSGPGARAYLRFDLTETALRDWVKQAEVDAGEREA